MVNPSGSLATCMNVMQKQQLASSVFYKDNIVREIHQGLDHMEGAVWKGALHPCGTASMLSRTVTKNTETVCIPKCAETIIPKENRKRLPKDYKENND